MVVQVDELSDRDREWALRLVEEQWGSTKIVTRGRVHDADALPGFVARIEGEPAGLATYRISDDECEVLSLDSVIEGQGVGTALIDAVKDAAVQSGCRRVWLITTNDNLHALRFYQKRGFVLAAVYPNALEQSRRLKPEIPLTGIDGIPLRDEIEFELVL